MLKNLDLKGWFFLKNRKIIFLLGVCFFVFVFTLIVTLDLTASLAVFILALSLVIFVFSFSRGWLFLLSSALLFSSWRLGEKEMLFLDFALSGLILIGLLKIFLEKGHFFHSWRYDGLFLAIILLSLIGTGISYYRNNFFHSEALRLGTNFFFYWFLFLIFQYFFQTEKRIRRFFGVLVFCSFFQSVRGLILFLSDFWFQKGVLDSSSELILPFILVGIFVSWGMWQTFKNGGNDDSKKRKFWLRLLQGVFFFQLLVFILISSPTKSVFLGLGFLLLGILSRDRRLVLVSAFLTLIFSIFSFFLVGNEDFSSSGIKFMRDLKTASSSFLPFGERNWPADFFQQNNSYFYFWGNLGVLGILALMGLLFSFFSDVYEKYKKSDGEKRIWLMVVLGVFIAFLMLAFKERIFFFGPVAILFWLLAGVAQNLGYREVAFGLTETVLEKQAVSDVEKKDDIMVKEKREREARRNYLDSCQPRFDFYRHQ